VSPLGTEATTGVKLKVGHVHYVSYPVGPLFAGFEGTKMCIQPVTLVHIGFVNIDL
jgi:hypothetical protein